MRSLARLALVGGAAAVLALPASASTNCVGEASTAYACVTTPNVVPGQTYCFYLGGPSCTPVTAVGTSGSVSASCGGQLLSFIAFC